MQGVAGWDGEEITGFRFDPLTGWNSGPVLVEIDRFAVTREDPTTNTGGSGWWAM